MKLSLALLFSAISLVVADPPGPTDREERAEGRNVTPYSVWCNTELDSVTGPQRDPIDFPCSGSEEETDVVTDGVSKVAMCHWNEGRKKYVDVCVAHASVASHLSHNHANANDYCGLCEEDSGGDPHFKTWTGEHFEFHGQCDLVFLKNKAFANDLGMDIQIRTKMVRYWSYIKQAAIRIGDDILEVQGAAADTEDDQVHYWINFQYQGKLETVGGFPVTIGHGSDAQHKRRFVIDLSSKYPDHRIVIQTFKEFLKIELDGISPDAYKGSVGMIGKHGTAKTYARDGVTELHDFNELGNEWQVLPSDEMLFHNVEEPQFPKKCIIPEDPQGTMRRRLAEASVTEEQAEEACATIKDALDRKDCVYDILATQDLDMVGAY